MIKSIRLSLARLLAPVALVLMLLALMAPALASGGAPAMAAAAPVVHAGGGTDDLEKLASTLQDPAARDKFIAHLKAAIAAQKGIEPEQDLEDGLIASVAERVREVGDEIVAAAAAMGDYPKLFAWFERQAADEAVRARWSSLLVKLAGVLAAGTLARIVTNRLLAAARRRIGRDAGARHPLLKLPLLLVHMVFDLLPLAAFTAAAYGVLPFFAPSKQASLVVTTLVGAFLIAEVAMAVARLVFAPSLPGLRMPPVGDESASYLILWARRLVYSAVWGYFLAAAGLALGLPKDGHAVILKAVGLVVATLLVILALQNRLTVAVWIRTFGHQADRHHPSMRLLRNRLADVWHVLAVFYVGATFAVWALAIKGGFEYVMRATVLTVVILVAARLLGSVARRLIKQGFAVGRDLKLRFPQLEGRANRYLPVLETIVRVTINGSAVLAVMQAWGVDAFGAMTSPSGKHVTGGLFTVGIILVVAFGIWEFFRAVTEHYLTPIDDNGRAIARSARVRTLLPLLRNVVMFLLVAMVALVVLSELGVDIAPLLAGAGVVGLAIGFGSQKLVQDIITGAFILFEDTVAVGDVIKIGEHSGVVEALSIRSLRLRDVSGSVHTLPFSSVSTVVNMTKDFAFAVFSIGVSYNEDTDEVIAVLREIGETLAADPAFAADLREPLEVMGVDSFADSAVVIKSRIKTAPGKQWGVQRAFNRLIKRAFDERGIEIPFPHHTVVFGEDKNGSAAPLRLKMHRDHKTETAPSPADMGSGTPGPDAPLTHLGDGAGEAAGHAVLGHSQTG